MCVVHEDSLSETERFSYYMIRYNPWPFKPMRSWDMRRWLLILMLTDILWFEKGIPEDPDTLLSYQVNPMPAEPILTQSIMRRILSYQEEDLVYICKKLKRPKWATRNNNLRGEITLTDARKHWPCY